MIRTPIRVLVIASTPLLAAFFFGFVEVVDRDSSRPAYDSNYSRLLYVVFVSAFAAVFAVVTGLELPLDARPWFPAFLVLGGFLYGVDTLTWMKWQGKSIRRGEESVVWLSPSLLAPIPEEILYRAGLGVLQNSVGTAGFVAVSAVLFGLAHVARGKKEIAFKTGNGVVYALVYVWTGSLVAPILAHFGYNVAYVWYVSDTSALKKPFGDP